MSKGCLCFLERCRGRISARHRPPSRASRPGELPGIDAQKVDIEVTGDILRLSGTSQVEALKEGETYLRQERNIGGFQRKIQLSFPVDSKKVEAHYEKGILSITLPRLEESLPKKIKVN